MKKIKLYSFMSIIVMAALTVIISCQKDNDSDNGPQKYSIGGSVEGLLGSGLVLQNNANDDLDISENGAFTFLTTLEDSSLYNVTIETYPVGQTCYVENENGMVDGENVTNVMVICETPDIVGDCSNGSIDYFHNLANAYGGFYQGIVVTGTVFFTCDEHGNLSGSGTLTIAVDGNISQSCAYIEYAGTATMNVSLTGTYSVAQTVFDLTETWYVGSPMANGTYTDLCGDDDAPYQIPLPEYTITHTLPFPTIDGMTITRPYEGEAGTGTYNWTLHII